MATLAGLVLLALWLLGVSAAAGPPPAGSLDPSFGRGGVVTYSPGYGDTYPSIAGIAVQPDGKIVAVGDVGPDSVLVRYLPNGSPDRSFGSGGHVETTAGDHVDAVALQPDGRIVVAGTRQLDDGECSEFLVARYNPNGTLDTGFGEQGVAITNVDAGSCPPGRYETASALAVLPGGEIVAAGTTDVEDDFGSSWFSLVRYTPNGSVDPTFNSVGVVKTVFTGGDALGGIVVLPSGKIVATGAGYGIGHGEDATATVLARYERDGSLDPGFGTNGKVITPPHNWQPGYYGGLPALQDGKIIVAGERIARFTANGRLDRTFGKSGFATFGSVSYPANVRPVAVQADGKILTVVGNSVVRLTPNGQPDKSFGAGGIVHLGARDGLSSLALQGDMKILVGGGDSDSWILTRLNGRTTYCVVPRVSGETIAAATAALRTSNCTRGAIAWHPSSTVARGRVLYTTPARGAERPGGYAVELVVSEGKG